MALNEADTRAQLVDPKLKAAGWWDTQVTCEFFYQQDYSYTRGQIYLVNTFSPFADGARCGMVVPEGTLFRGGPFADVKRELLEQFNLHTVVSLPPGTFAPYSDVKTALIFFERPGPTEEIWYYELPLPPGLKKFSKGSPIRDEHFEEAKRLWREWDAYRKGRDPSPPSAPG